MSHKTHGNPVATYIVTALILGVITYVEYALVEYNLAWLSRGWIFFLLFALSIAKFLMVIAIFMHLKDDEKTYSGFFGSGLIIALATFMILPLLFTVRTIPGQAAGAPTEAHADAEAEEHGLGQETRSLIESDGASRAREERLDTPRPADRSLGIQPPAAAEPRATIRPQQERAQPQATAEADADEAQAATREPAGFDRELGNATYVNCQGCHQATGAGLPGFAPPLAANMPRLHNAEGGREYLIDVLLYGLSGEIQVDGQTYNNNMPAWPQLSDEQIAAVLNHELTSWGNEEALTEFTPITSGEVAARRSADAGNLLERRSQLQAQ
jgi:mono/diheme cytochrome c family protein/heme/copper-type cytochrome/quinol oxidase subunit 4